MNTEEFHRKLTAILSADIYGDGSLPFILYYNFNTRRYIMPTYITLINFTDQAIKNIKDFEKIQQEAIKRGEMLGVKVTGVYITMGEYDGVAICECSGDEAAVAGALTAASDGNIRTKTLRAFTPEEFGKIVGMLP